MRGATKPLQTVPTGARNRRRALPASSASETLADVVMEVKSQEVVPNVVVWRLVPPVFGSSETTDGSRVWPNEHPGKRPTHATNSRSSTVPMWSTTSQEVQHIFHTQISVHPDLSVSDKCLLDVFVMQLHKFCVVEQGMFALQEDETSISEETSKARRSFRSYTRLVNTSAAAIGRKQGRCHRTS